jgi:hypothetical protein
VLDSLALLLRLVDSCASFRLRDNVMIPSPIGGTSEFCLLSLQLTGGGLYSLLALLFYWDAAGFFLLLLAYGGCLCSFIGVWRFFFFFFFNIHHIHQLPDFTTM